MSLARVTNPMATSIVKVLGDSGGALTRDVTAEIDNLIAWAKDAPRVIHTNTSQVGNVGAGLDSLHSFSLDTPNRLNTNGDYLRVWYGGNFAANNNDKRVVANFSGTLYEDTGLFDLDGAVGWVFDVRIIRLSSTSVLVSSQFLANLIAADSAASVTTGTAGGYLIGRNKVITGLSDLGANAQTLLVQGEATANDDVFQNLSIVELRQQ